VPELIFEALISVRAAPLPVNEVPVIVPAENSPDDPRRTIVEAPLAIAAVVLAFAIVPVAILEALIAVKATPLPDIEVAVIPPALKLPDESRETIVEAPLAEAAVVRALATVPDDRLEALIAVIAVPSPLNEEALITLEPKFPEASRRTIVLALFDVLPVVRALDIVPLVMFEALMSVRLAALPEILVNDPVVPVTTLAAKEPLESRATMVEAPFAELAVVLPLVKVPTEILEALIDTLAALVSWP
jgi:hypothetical protein